MRTSASNEPTPGSGNKRASFILDKTNDRLRLQIARVTYLNKGLSLNSASQASAALSVVACGDLGFVGGEGCQDFVLLALRDLEEV